MMVVKVRFIYILPLMPPQQCCVSQPRPQQTRSHGLWPVAIQPNVALVCRFMVSTPSPPFDNI